MKKKEFVYREMLYNAIEMKKRTLTQAYLAKTLKISLSTVNNALKPLRAMNAVRIKLKNFEIIDIKKILLYWASIRNIEKDIIFKTRVEMPVREIERLMPDDIVFSAYSGYKFKFKDVPADYSEVYIYGGNIERRFKKNGRTPNLFVMKEDDFIDRYGKTITIGQLFVDLWNLKEWYAKDFLKSLEAKLYGILE